MIKQICVCNNCGKELTMPTKYHIDFATSKFCDAAGDMDYNSLRVDLCEECAEDAIKTLKALLEKSDATSTEKSNEKCDCYEVRKERHYLSDYEKGMRAVFAMRNGKLSFAQVPESEIIEQGYCKGTKEYEQCSCDGDRSKCNFYKSK